jgi:nitroreductase
MQKPASTRYPIHELIQERWSPRAFAGRPVEPEKLYSLFEAARWAPSSFNEQPWGFIVATMQDAEAHARIAACLVEGNRVWAEAAPVLMMSVAKLQFDHTGKENRHAYHDVGLAMGMVLVEATHLGLFVHQMAGFDRDQARSSLEIPETHEPVAAIALGYPGDAEKLPAKLQEKEYAPRSRNDFDAFVWAGKFGEPMPFESRVRRALKGD